MTFIFGSCSMPNPAETTQHLTGFRKLGLRQIPRNSAGIRVPHSTPASPSLSRRGYIHSYISPSVYENGAERQSGLGTPDPVYTKVNEVYGDPEGLEPDSPQWGLTTGYFSGEAAAVSEGYSMDAFFITDGRSRKRPESAPRERAQRHTCSECGKTYATSSNLSRHKQTHRSLDSKLARKCPTCSKVYVSMPALAMHVLTHDLKHKCETCGKALEDDRRASISKIHCTKLGKCTCNNLSLE